MLWMLLIARAPALDCPEGHMLADDGLPFDDLDDDGRIDLVQLLR